MRHQQIMKTCWLCCTCFTHCLFGLPLCCFALLGQFCIVSLLSGFRCGVRSGPHLGLSSGCCKLLQHCILIWYLASTSSPFFVYRSTLSPFFVFCFDIESDFCMLPRHRIRISHFVADGAIRYPQSCENRAFWLPWFLSGFGIESGFRILPQNRIRFP